MPEADQPKRPPHLHRDIPEHPSPAGGRIAVVMVVIALALVIGVFLSMLFLP